MSEDYYANGAGDPHDDWYCPECDDSMELDELHEEQIGAEEKARKVMVARLTCGHELVWTRR